MQQQNKGILLVILATLCLTIQDALTKHLSDHMPTLQFVALRYLTLFAFACWWCTRHTSFKQVLTVGSTKKQILRGLLLAAELMLYASIVRHLALAEISAIMVTFPLIVTLLSPWMLGETVGWRRWAAVGVGFMGALILIAPGSVSFNGYSLLALCCAIMFGTYNVMTRQVSQTDSADSSFFYIGLVGVIIFTPMLPFIWQPIPEGQMIWLIALCIISVVSHYLMIWALKLTAAVVLQPFNYFILPWAIIIGFVIFDESILGHQWLGAALIVSGGIYIGYRQRALYH